MDALKQRTQLPPFRKRRKHLQHEDLLIRNNLYLVFHWRKFYDIVNVAIELLVKTNIVFIMPERNIEKSAAWKDSE
ncbi:hypothetical protein M514_04488, partial [Trichuris suis]